MHWGTKYSFDSLYGDGLEPNPQHLWGVPVFQITVSSWRQRDTVKGLLLMITVGLVCLSKGRRQSLEAHRSRLGNWMQNFSQCKSWYPCKSAKWFSTCFHSSYILPTSAILCQHTRIRKHAWCSLISSWTFVLLALHLASLFVAGLVLSSDLGLSTLAIPYRLPHPALFSLFGLNAPTSWSRFVLFWFSWTSLSMSWASLSVMIFGCLFWSGLKSLLLRCVHGQSPGQGEGPVVGLAADCSVGLFLPCVGS